MTNFWKAILESLDWRQMTSRLVTVELSVDRGGREATVRTLIYQTWARPDKHQIRAACPAQEIALALLSLSLSHTNIHTHTLTHTEWPFTPQVAIEILLPLNTLWNSWPREGKCVCVYMFMCSHQFCWLCLGYIVNVIYIQYKIHCLSRQQRSHIQNQWMVFQPCFSMNPPVSQTMWVGLCIFYWWDFGRCAFWSTKS